MSQAASDPAASLVVELHPGPGTRVICDGEPGELPILVVSDGTAEVLISPATPVTPATVDFAERLAYAVGDYLLAVRRLAER